MNAYSATVSFLLVMGVVTVSVLFIVVVVGITVVGAVVAVTVVCERVGLQRESEEIHYVWIWWCLDSVPVCLQTLSEVGATRVWSVAICSELWWCTKQMHCSNSTSTAIDYPPHSASDILPPEL